MVALIKIVRWVCPNCKKEHDTMNTNEHPFCIHRAHVEWVDHVPTVVVDLGFHMELQSERWA